MTTTLRTLFATAIAAATLCALPAAHAANAFNGISINGIQINGISINGIQLNGFSLNGMKQNGLQLNGMKSNGLVLNGMRANGSELDGQDASLPAVEAIVLRDGRTMDLR